MCDIAPPLVVICGPHEIGLDFVVYHLWNLVSRDNSVTYPILRHMLGNTSNQQLHL